MNGSNYKMVFAFIAIFCSFTNFETIAPVRKKMEITKVVNDKGKINRFVSKHFEPVNLSYKNPIFPCKVNFKEKTKRPIYFCNFPVVDCWVLKHENSFTFFLLIKNNSNLVDVISKKYGEQQIESEIEADNNSMHSKTYYWEVGQLNIILNSFRNINKTPKYDECVMVTIGNMSYADILTFPLKGF